MIRFPTSVGSPSSGVFTVQMDSLKQCQLRPKETFSGAIHVPPKTSDSHLGTAGQIRCLSTSRLAFPSDRVSHEANIWVDSSHSRVTSGRLGAAVKTTWQKPFSLRPLARLIDQAASRRRSLQPMAFWRSHSEGQAVPPKDDNSSAIVSQLELERGTRPDHRHSGFNGVFLLLLVNLAMYVADHLLHIPAVKLLYLYHASPRWYQFVTATFCHAGWSHLSGNLFFVYIFGKLVEEEEGAFGVWATYLVTGVGANLCSWLLLPATAVSVGASGAVFGLFAVSVLVKVSFKWRKLLEVLILGQFVVEKVISEATASASVQGRHLAGGNINHVAHLAGAMLGVGLIWLISRLPGGDEDESQPGSSNGSIR